VLEAEAATQATDEELAEAAEAVVTLRAGEEEGVRVSSSCEGVACGTGGMRLGSVRIRRRVGTAERG